MVLEDQTVKCKFLELTLSRKPDHSCRKSLVDQERIQRPDHNI